MLENIKNVIIGSGEGGKFLAWHLARSGEPAAVIERRMIGGSCPNTNCLPSKNEIWSATVAHLTRHANAFGVDIAEQDVSVDMVAVRQRKRDMVEGLIQLHLDNFRSSGTELVMGNATLIGERLLEVQLNDGGTRTISADRLFLNLGTHATIPAVPGLVEAQPMTHVDLLELDRVPAYLVVVGGGYVGLEFAQAFRRFGSQVTVLQHGSQLLSNQDDDVSSEISLALRDEGIEIVTSVDIKSVTGRSGLRVGIDLCTPDGDRRINASHILVAAGRTPNTANIGLQTAGVEVNAQNYIRVNDRLETSAENVWAIGECAGSPQFTHASFDDFRVIRDNLAGGNRSTEDRLMPSCLFTDPQVAHIGLSEREAAQQGMVVQTVRLPMKAVLRTRTLGETHGFMKALIDADDKIVGFTMVGPAAGEVMFAVQLAMQAQLPFTVFRDAIIAHPTMAEGLGTLFSSAKQSSKSNQQFAHT